MISFPVADLSNEVSFYKDNRKHHAVEKTLHGKIPSAATGLTVDSLCKIFVAKVGWNCSLYSSNLQVVFSCSERAW